MGTACRSFGAGHRAAVGFLDRIRSFLAPPAPALDVRGAFGADDEVARGLIAAGFDPGQADELGQALAKSIGGWRLPRRGSAELLAAYGRTPWLHATTRRRAEALASVEWTVWKSTTTGLPTGRLQGMRSAQHIRAAAAAEHVRQKRMVQVTDHPLLDLLEAPTSGMPGFQFWELLSKWLDLVGEAPQAMVFDGDVEPIELTPILPTLITQVATSDAPWFEMQTPRGVVFRVPEEDMLWVRQHDPGDPYLGRGVGTAHVLADEIETDEYMSATAKARFYNRGHPDYFIGFIPPGGPGSQNMGPEAMKRIAAEIDAKHAGINKAGRIHLIDRDVRVAALGQTLVENQYIDGRKFLRDACMQVFGVPPEILGVLTSSNRSTIDAADYLFAKFSTVPQLERLRAFYQSQLVPLFGDDVVLDYVSPIPADKEFKKSVMVALPQAFTINQVLALVGEEPRPDGNRPYPAPGVVPVAGAPKKETPDADP